MAKGIKVEDSGERIGKQGVGLGGIGFQPVGLF